MSSAKERARLELRSELASAPAPHVLVAQQAGVPLPDRAAELFGELERRVLNAFVPA